MFSHAPESRPGVDRRVIGQRAEDIAAQFLTEQGLTVVLRNYRVKMGELDIVASEAADVLVIAEVRTRASAEYGGAAASVDGWKQRCVVRTAARLLQDRKDLALYRVRFDVIVVADVDSPKPRVEWIKHAFAS
jgi:putative endonuclease